MVRGRRPDRSDQRLVDRALGCLPRREAHLDAELGVVQRRLGFSADGGGFLAGLRGGDEAVGGSAGGQRGEFDRRGLPCRVAARIYLSHTADSSGSEQLQSFRRSLRASVRWRVCADRLLGRIVLDVSQENFLTNLKEMG